MSDTISVEPTLASEGDHPLDKYRSRPRQLATWLLASRDALREKYQELKVESKRLKVRISDVAKSRENWRRRAEVSDQQVRMIKAEVERLTAQVEQAVDSSLKKK
jgi:methyl-accepting chemotaxis protein